jgi:hypothetical protein
MVSDDSFPWITPQDITPLIAKTSRDLIEMSDRGRLTLTILERALVGYTRTLEAQVKDEKSS